MIIILDQLGVLDKMQDELGSVNEVARTLSMITNIKQQTIQSYINPILQGIPDKTNKNSPYKNPKNIINAKKLLNIN